MTYPTLPEWEQVRKPKELPPWWDEFEATLSDIDAEASKKPANRYADLPGMQAILCCLEDANEPLRFREIVNRLERQETSVAGWLRRLMGNGKITYENRHKIRYWRRLHPGEPSRHLDTERHGSIQRQLIALLKPNPERWFTPVELKQLLGIDRTNKIIQSLQSLVRTGEVRARLEPTRVPVHPRRHPYRYQITKLNKNAK